MAGAKHSLDLKSMKMPNGHQVFFGSKIIAARCFLDQKC